MERDRALEESFLEGASSAPPAFLEQARARIEHTEAAHGNEGWERDVDELLAEAQEEAADICGWLTGASYQLDAVEKQRALVAINLGAAAWRELEELRERIGMRRARE